MILPSYWLNKNKILNKNESETERGPESLCSLCVLILKQEWLLCLDHFIDRLGNFRQYQFIYV